MLGAEEEERIVSKIVPLTMIGFALTGLAGAGEIIEIHKGGQLGEPTSDQALVYFLRPSMLGKAVKTWAFVDDQVVGATKGKTCTFGHVSPGTHVFWAKAENVSAVEMEVAAGKTYYLKQAARMGGLKARVKLIPLDEGEGRETLGKCKKTTTLTAAGEERATELIGEYHERALEKAANRDAEDET